MAADSVDLNATCELLRQLSELTVVYRDDDSNRAANSTSGQLAGYESAKYLLRDVVNPALCVVQTPLCSLRQVGRLQYSKSTLENKLYITSP